MNAKTNISSTLRIVAILLLTPVFCFLSSSKAKAQVGEHRNDLAIGVNFGYTINKVTFSPIIKQKWKDNPSGGITLRYTCEKYFSCLCALQVELNYANLGWEELIETSTDTYTRNMHYIQFPMLARLAWGREEKGAMFYFLAGPQLGYCIGEQEIKGGAFDESTLNKRPGGIVQQYGKMNDNALDYGITAGLGLEINTKRAGYFMVEGRYYFALGDIYNNGKRDPFSRSANGTIVAKLTYLFDVIKTER